MRVVLDTNILVAAMRGRGGASFRIMQWIDEGRIHPIISVPLMMEYEEVLKRVGTIPGIGPQEVDTFLDYLMSRSSEQRVFFLWRPWLTDADDEMLLEAAFASGADYLVTHNIRDFAPAASLGIKVVTPHEFAIIFLST